MDLLGVHVELSHEATAEEIRNFGADKVIIATGSMLNCLKSVLGINHPSLVFARDALMGNTQVEGNIVVACVQGAFCEHTAPPIMNSDQGSAFGSNAYVSLLVSSRVTQNMDGRALPVAELRHAGKLVLHGNQLEGGAGGCRRARMGAPSDVGFR